MLGEAAVTAEDAERFRRAYAEAIAAIGAASAGRGVLLGPGISIKLSALHPRYVRAQRDRVLAELYPRVLDLARRAMGHGIGAGGFGDLPAPIQHQSVVVTFRLDRMFRQSANHI